MELEIQTLFQGSQVKSDLVMWFILRALTILLLHCLSILFFQPFFILNLSFFFVFSSRPHLYHTVLVYRVNFSRVYICLRGYIYIRDSSHSNFIPISVDSKSSRNISTLVNKIALTW